MLNDNDLQFEDFTNFYPAAKASHDTHKAMAINRAANTAFPHIHNIFTLIKRSAKNGKFEIEYHPLDWNSSNTLYYTERFLEKAGYKVESSNFKLKISWDDGIRYGN
ncbi:hypothetical protein KKJ25_02900 [Xenorhabdus bovienii]|uniref:Uncharacterized protein n=1 Tax=Xenorhabdus bovienii TaxID=40576 RepID=A0AAJ1J5J5_XENBV|nr:hypothetical protein [Xenorhabdus bovienii]MDE1477665.1 hypothetical protein [Xenorhabdus bovienii]MDE1493939.1 hypothetical protein [Xenorhabdus bovienii]MDE9471952.1 hypothetical protein [Xenorhabdus bovienii]MDE9509406.1 hypothetical protein [Xenorhabdus bovienii]MDE9521051.1 hypothetical protein [Xenorhabdus bovienii]